MVVLGLCACNEFIQIHSMFSPKTVTCNLLFKCNYAEMVIHLQLAKVKPRPKILHRFLGTKVYIFNPYGI